MRRSLTLSLPLSLPALSLPVLTLPALLLLAPAMAAQPDCPLVSGPLPDEKAVFATVETTNVVQARVRTGGTIASLAVREGDTVQPGQVVATIGDEKLVLQQDALAAQIAAARAQLEQARTDLSRAESLAQGGFVTKARLDELRTAVNVATNTLRAREAERAVLDQRLREGEVLAPTAGRVLTVPVTPGAVVQAGEVVASIARGDFVLRLRIPERHAGGLAVDDPVRLDGADLAAGGSATGDAGGDGGGRIVLIYPRIEDGRVTADARIEGIGDRFVGRRVRVWIPAGERQATVVPAACIETRFGLDYARIRQADGGTATVPVQRGQPRALPGMPDGLEILSGLTPDDVLVRP